MTKCLTCGCDRDDHFEPDWYDPRTEELYGSGHLNYCGDCAECYEPEYAALERGQYLEEIQTPRVGLDESPSYRQHMRDAGRGGLLR